MVGGASLSEETIRSLKELLRPGANVLNGYDMSETTISLPRETRNDKGASVGRPSAGVSLRIVDDNGDDVAVGTDGECLIKSPTVFMGYKGNKAETDAAFKGGWLCSGDVVRVDNDGFFYLTGRKKELIKFKGNQVGPAELEAVLLTHALVEDVGVCGVYDSNLETEVPVGFIILSASVKDVEGKALLENVQGFVDERVAPYKKLRGGLFCVEALPKNTSGTLLRRKLAIMAEGQRSLKHKL